MLPQPPYGLVPIVFRFRALAALAGRLPIGGEREVAMAAFVAARLAAAVIVTPILTEDVRKARVAGARQWVGSLAIPVPTRSALLQLAERAGDGDREAVLHALERVSTQVAGVLDGASRSELRQLATALRSA